MLHNVPMNIIQTTSNVSRCKGKTVVRKTVKKAHDHGTVVMHGECLMPKNLNSCNLSVHIGIALSIGVGNRMGSRTKCERIIKVTNAVQKTI